MSSIPLEPTGTAGIAQRAPLSPGLDTLGRLTDRGQQVALVAAALHLPPTSTASPSSSRRRHGNAASPGCC